jgi:4-hydroxybenzoate polyprenyltransferase
LNPFSSITYLGVSPGQRITIILISVLVTFYSYLKRKNWLVSIFLFFITLIIILFWGALPIILAGNRPEYVYLPGGILNSDTQKFAAIFALLFLFSLFIYYYLLNKNYFKILIKSLRFERMLFYSGIGIFGFIIGIHQQGLTFTADLFDIVGIILLVLSLALGFQAAQVINDFFDIESDRLSRKRNPLVQDLNRNYYLIWGFCLIVLALGFTLIINCSCFLLMLSYLLLSIIYSVPPVRLKRIPVISTFILAVAVILAMAMGYSLTFSNHALNAIPKTILIPTLLGITFGFIAKDIQDLNSDRSTGVITLPSILYKDSFIGRLPVAILIGISYSFYIIFIPRVLIGAIIFSALTIIYTIFIKKPKEWLYFIMLYLFGCYLLLVLLKG